MRNKILSLLVLLLTAATGAWAQGLYNVFEVTQDMVASWTNDKTAVSAADLPTFGAVTEDEAKAWTGAPATGLSYLIYDFNGEKTKYVKFEDGKWSSVGEYNWIRSEMQGDISKGIKIFYTGLFVIPGATAGTWTFTMPGSNVMLTPVYAPVAKWAVSSEVDQIPTAIDGIFAGEAKDIVKAGTVAKVGSTENAQGTVMYLTTTDANMTKEQARDAVTSWTSTVPTGAVLTGSYAEDQTVYVWYYIKGIDAAEGVTPTAENTFSDSEICETPLTVTLKANQFTLTLNPAPVKNITVTAGTETKTPTTEGKTDIKMNSEVKLKANEGYKIKKVVIKKDPVAEGHALTSAKLGEIVCSDGKAYAAADKDILPKGVKAEALVCYVDGEHGLALAMADVKNAKMSWDNDRGANDDKTAAQWCDGWNTSHPIAGATWLLASQTQWNNMISAAGSASNLSNAFSAVGGTNLQAWSYWSSTTLHSGTAAYLYYFPSSSWQWVYFNGEGDNGCYIRACLEW